MFGIRNFLSLTGIITLVCSVLIIITPMISNASNAEAKDNFLVARDDFLINFTNTTNVPIIRTGNPNPNSSIAFATCGTGNCGPGTTCSQYGECLCIDSEDMIFEEETSSCFSLVGTACFLEPIVGVVKNCVENAYCDPDNALTGYCVCEDGFDPNADRLCGTATLRTTVSRGTSVSTIGTVPSSTSTTQFSSTTRTTEDPDIVHPPGIVGQSCNVVSGRDCVANAVCTDGYCICDRGFIHQEDFRSCLSSSDPHSRYRNNFLEWILLLFLISSVNNLLQ